MFLHLAQSCVFRFRNGRGQLLSSTFSIRGMLSRGGPQITVETTLPEVSDRELCPLSSKIYRFRTSSAWLWHVLLTALRAQHPLIEVRTL